MRETAGLDGYQKRHRVDVTTRHLARAFHGVNPEVDLAVAGADDRARRHGGVVARAEHDSAGDIRAVQRPPHRLARRIADAFRVAFAQKTGACKRGGFGGVNELEGNLAARLE